MVIDSAIKSRVVQMAIDGGYGRNQITRELNKQGVKISTTTVTHLIQNWKRQHQQVQYEASVSSISQKEQQQEDKTQETITISREPKTPQCTAINIGMPPSICNGSPSSNASYSGDGLKPEPDSEPDPKTLGGPLKFFLNKIVSPTAVAAVVAIAPTTEYNHSIPSNPVNLNPIKADEDIPNSNLHPPAPVSTLSIPSKAEAFPDRNLFIKDPETDMQVNIESDANVKYFNQDVNSQNATLEEKEEGEFEQSQSQSVLPGSDDPSVAIDWDSEKNWERRFFKSIMDEKKIRQEEERKLEEQRGHLIQERYNIEEQKKALEAREAKLFEVEELIPSAKQLKDIGIGFDQALVWIDCIKEVSDKERVDLRTAAWKLADILRSFKELSDLEKTIQQATQQLAMLNMVNDQQKRAINTLVHLQQIGMTEDEIGELVKLVGGWNSTGVGVGQGNCGRGNNNYNMNNNGGKNPNTILKLDDKLNLPTYQS